MTYQVQVWDFKNKESEMQEFYETLTQDKKVLMVLSQELNDCVIMVSNNIERDMMQAEKIANALNREE